MFTQEETNEILGRHYIESLQIHGNTLLSERHFCENAVKLWEKEHNEKVTDAEIKLLSSAKDLNTLMNNDIIVKYLEVCEKILGKKLKIRLYPQTEIFTVDSVIFETIN